MAISPNPEIVPEIMRREFGTTVLITNPASDRILEKSNRHGNERYSRPCGGAGGFDDYCERMD